MKTIKCLKHPRYTGIRPPKNSCHTCVMVYMELLGLGEICQSASQMSNVLYNYSQGSSDLPLREADKMVMKTQCRKWDEVSARFNEKYKV